jgi:hypothetical protein
MKDKWCEELHDDLVQKNEERKYIEKLHAKIKKLESQLAAVPAQEPIAYKVVVTLNGEITRSTFEPRKMLEANKKFITDNGYKVVETPLFTQQPAQEPVKQESKGHCKLGDECNCGGDLPRIRECCSSWVMPPV